MVTDLRHLLDLQPDAPGPVLRLASYLGGIVKAATAGDVGVAWQTVLPCRRRPGHRPCPATWSWCAQRRTSRFGGSAAPAVTPE